MDRATAPASTYGLGGQPDDAQPPAVSSGTPSSKRASSRRASAGRPEQSQAQQGQGQYGGQYQAGPDNGTGGQYTLGQQLGDTQFGAPHQLGGAPNGSGQYAPSAAATRPAAIRAAAGAGRSTGRPFYRRPVRPACPAGRGPVRRPAAARQRPGRSGSVRARTAVRERPAARRRPARRRPARRGRPAVGGTQYGGRSVRGGPVRCARAVRHRPAVRRWPANGPVSEQGQRRTTTRATTTRATPRLAARSRFRPGLSSRADSVTGVFALRRGRRIRDARAAGEQTQTAGDGAPAGQFAETAGALSAPVPADAASADQWSPNGAQTRQATGAYPAYATGPAAARNGWAGSRRRRAGRVPAARVSAAARISAACLPGGAAARVPSRDRRAGGAPRDWSHERVPGRDGQSAGRVSGDQRRLRRRPCGQRAVGNGYEGNGYAANGQRRPATQATATPQTTRPRTARCERPGRMVSHERLSGQWLAANDQASNGYAANAQAPNGSVATATQRNGHQATATRPAPVGPAPSPAPGTPRRNRRVPGQRPGCGRFGPNGYSANGHDAGNGYRPAQPPAARRLAPQPVGTPGFTPTFTPNGAPKPRPQNGTSQPGRPEQYPAQNVQPSAVYPVRTASRPVPTRARARARTVRRPARTRPRPAIRTAPIIPSPALRRTGRTASRRPSTRRRLSRGPRPDRPVDGRAPVVAGLRPGRPVRPFPAELLGVTW